MKKSILVLLAVGLMHAQAFKGKGDVKFDVGANFQEGGSGIRVSADFGLGENMSYGFATSYLLSVSNDDLGNKPEFDDRIDAKVRCELRKCISTRRKMDIYPGLNLGLRNFGTLRIALISLQDLEFY
jgi:hypothetical protein